MPLPSFEPETWAPFWTALVGRAVSLRIQGYVLTKEEYAKTSETPWTGAQPPSGDSTTAHMFGYTKWKDEQIAIELLKAEVIEAVSVVYLRNVPGFDHALGVALIPLSTIIKHMRTEYGTTTVAHVARAVGELEALRYDSAGDSVHVLIGSSLAAHSVLSHAGQPLSEIQKVGYLARALDAADPLLAKLARKLYMKNPNPATIKFEEYAADVTATDAAIVATRLQQQGLIRPHFAAATAATASQPSLSYTSQDSALMAELRSVKQMLKALTSSATPVAAAVAPATTTRRFPTPPSRRRRPSPSTTKSDGRPRESQAGWCWTHGRCAHGSLDCKNPAPNHRKQATVANPMGGAPNERRRPGR